VFVSPETRFSASETKATKRPSALIDGDWLSWSPWIPVLLTLMSSVNPGAGRAAAVPERTRTPAIASAKSLIERM
jgi:hypothetical protein